MFNSYVFGRERGGRTVCVAIGILQMNDGDEEGFVKDESREVLIDVNEERGIVRRQRVYRSLLMTMGLCRSLENEEDYVYTKNYRNMIQGDLEELFPCELQVYRSGAYLVLGEERWSFT